MNIKNIENIENRFTPDQIATIKSFMEYCVETNQTDSKTFSDIEVETESEIAESVKTWLRSRKQKGHRV
jgi:hypothetical protein